MNWFIKKIKISRDWIILIVIVGTAFVFWIEYGLNPPIPPELQLKAPKTDIIDSFQYSDNNNNQPVVAYVYKSEEDAPLLDNEIIEKRTETIVTRLEKENEDGSTEYSAQSGYEFYKDDKGNWKKVKHATTTPEVFNKVSLMERLINTVFAAQTASTSPTLGVNVAGDGIDWLTPTNIYTSNDVRATAALTDVDWFSDLLRATGFGFTIPTGATIDGIIVEVEKSATVADLITDYSVWIVKGGAETGTDHYSSSYWPIADAYTTYGTSIDKWGTTWTPADINATNFGFSISAANNDVVARSARVDHMRITVYYTAPSRPGGVPAEKVRGGVKVRGGAAVAAKTASTSPTLGVNVADVGTDWGNPTNIYTSNDGYASASLAYGATSDYLRATQFGFTIPTGATINGIVAEAERKQNTPSASIGNIRDSSIKIVKASAEIGTDHTTGTNYPPTEAYVSFGNSTDLWGTTWTATEVNATGFGVSFMATNGGGTAFANTGYVDHIRITVYYTMAGGVKFK